MLTKQNMADMLQGKMISKETIDVIFNDLENQLLDKREVTVDLKKVTFISVYFLEQFEKLIEKSIKLDVKVEIVNVNSDIYKVFQVGRMRNVLDACIG